MASSLNPFILESALSAQGTDEDGMTRLSLELPHFFFLFSVLFLTLSVAAQVVLSFYLLFLYIQ